MLFENYSLSSSTISSKNNGRYSKNAQKISYVCLNEVTWLTTIKRRLKMKNRLNRYNINRLRSRHGHKYTKYKYVSVKWWLYVLSNTKATFEAQFMKKFSKTKAELKKALLIKKRVINFYYPENLPFSDNFRGIEVKRFA